MRIALFVPNWVGDAVMATPAIQAIRSQWPNARIVGVGRSHIGDVLAGSPWFDDFAEVDRSGPFCTRFWSIVRRFRRENIDLAVLFPNSFRTALLARLGGCRQRVGFARYGRSMLLSDRLEPVRDASGRLKPAPIVLDYNRLAERAGAVVDDLKLALFTTPADELAADRVWSRAEFQADTRVVCLNPGAAFGASKLWPAEYFARLARRLIDDQDCKILVVCGPAERDLARRIAALSNRTQVHTLADEAVSLGLTKACIRRCHLLISTDSGPRHFAAAFGRPVVALFGPTHIEWTDTFFPREIRLQRKVPCGPCQQRTCSTDHRCMKELTPEHVYPAALQLLTDQSVKEAARV